MSTLVSQHPGLPSGPFTEDSFANWTLNDFLALTEELRKSKGSSKPVECHLTHFCSINIDLTDVSKEGISNPRPFKFKRCDFSVRAQSSSSPLDRREHCSSSSSVEEGHYAFSIYETTYARRKWPPA
uniref:Uncharacterized protein n=1 Tax=Kwoniella bestiolae CBS 10118 TaxID=1296100 RepID=A0A1B9G7H5_9TREE|nr:hypothetical protein I302_04631 [Kwoniella bestiolae CBS 10118]OCF26940.1 hypothetical protein I302_04631 [Kwoniella bestiolae CBS 10118]